MTTKPSPSRRPSQVRADAEAILARTEPAGEPTRPAEELLHELQVHQIELEMQNEALRQAQAELEASHGRYVDLYEFAPVGYITLSREGVITQINLAGATLLGRARGKLLRVRFASFVVAEDRDRWYRHQVQVMRQPEKQRCEIALQGDTGEIRHVQADCQRLIREDASPAVRIALTDVTERRQADDARREGEARFRVMADTAPVMIWLSDTDQQYTWFNQRWLEFTGRRVEQELGNGWAEGVHADDVQRCLAVYSAGFERREAFEREYRLRNADGDYRWLLERGVPRYSSEGKFVGYIGSCIDITQRRLIAQQLVEAKDAAELADGAKSVFLSNMSHEIRTPLHVIIGLGHLLRRDCSDPVHLERLDRLCATSDHLLAIINDILDLSKIDAHKLVLDHGDFRLDAVVDQVLRMVIWRANEKGLTLNTDVAPQLRGMAFNGDALRLAQVLINLCGNAVKFTDQGAVRLSIECLAEDAASVTLRFAVEDTGIGIAPADQARLFQPFTQVDGSSTRRHEGTGLGLSISQRLVTLMGGTLQVESSLGAGSTFRFELILPHAAANVPVAVSARDAADFYGSRVLLVEDHPLSQEILLEMLEDLGCEGDVASNGAEAVGCARERSYDLILMDMQMPKMDGLAATRAIRRLPGHRDTPIVALTANAFADDRQRCFDAGMNGHLAKPVTQATLVAALGQWLPDLAAVPGDQTPACHNALSRAVAEIPHLAVGSSWRRSPQHLSEYCVQLDRFVTLHNQDMPRLREHLASGQHDAAHVVAHNLKGIAGLMGARRVATLANEIVRGLRAGADEASITLLTVDCEAELASLANAVRALPMPPTESAAK